jgi:hypothetical protein
MTLILISSGGGESVLDRTFLGEVIERVGDDLNRYRVHRVDWPDGFTEVIYNTRQYPLQVGQVVPYGYARNGAFTLT